MVDAFVHSQANGSFCRYRKSLYLVPLGLLFIWYSFVFCVLFLLFYVICAPVPEIIVSSSLGITFYLVFFCVLCFVSFVLRHLCSGTCRRSQANADL